MFTKMTSFTGGIWERYLMAMEEVSDRLMRICTALSAARVPFALVGGQAVAIWVATKDPAAVRTTKDVDILLRREDLPRARAAAAAVGLDYFEVQNVGMFLERSDANPRTAVHLVWAEEKVKPHESVAAPSVSDSEVLGPGLPVVSLPALVAMKLMANRDHDRVHLRDLIDVGLVSREILAKLPQELAERLEPLFVERGA